MFIMCNCNFYMCNLGLNKRRRVSNSRSVSGELDFLVQSPAVCRLLWQQADSNWKENLFQKCTL